MNIITLHEFLCDTFFIYNNNPFDYNFIPTQRECVINFAPTTWYTVIVIGNVFITKKIC